MEVYIHAYKGRKSENELIGVYSIKKLTYDYDCESFVEYTSGQTTGIPPRKCHHMSPHKFKPNFWDSMAPVPSTASVAY